MRSTAIGWLVVMCASAMGSQACAQSIRSYGFSPPVLSATGPERVSVSVSIAGTASRVSLEFNPGQLGVRSTHDLQAGPAGAGAAADERVYATELPTAPILGAMRSDDVHTVFVGFLDVFDGGGSRTARLNLFVQVHTAELGAPPVLRLAPQVQATDQVVNIVAPAVFETRDLAEVTKEFYRWFADDVDFLNIVFHPPRVDNRTHVVLRNDVDGIGLARSDSTAAYGSAGRLRGISQFPIMSLFDGAQTGYVHELGHQWVNYLRLAPLTAGIPHWPYSSMAGGVMGFSIGGSGGQGGTFACIVEERQGTIVLRPRPDGPVFNDFDLYLMGLLAPDRVAPQWVFDDAFEASRLVCNGQTFGGSMTRVTVQDLIREFGPRLPAAGAAPTNFRVATLLVTRDGLASQETMALVSWLAQRAQARTPLPVHEGLVKYLGMPFFVATGGRATLETGLALRRPASITGSPAGPLAARVLTATLRPEMADAGRLRQVFVAAQVGAQWFFRTAAGIWQAWNGGPMPVGAVLALDLETVIPVLDGQSDLSALAGTPIYVGYGIDEAEMLAAGRYARIHVLR